METKALIVFGSPAGSTRLVAEVISKTLCRHFSNVTLYDLFNIRDRSLIFDELKSEGEKTCLFLGTPVYRDVVIPPIMKFIEELPEIKGAFAAPFVTWGKACSGIALYQMGEKFIQKGFEIIGAAKVLAVHSLMWALNEPVGKGHPDEIDINKVTKWANTIYRRLDSKNTPSLSLDVLDYQPDEVSLELKKKIQTPWMTIPKRLNEEKCTKCGICMEECPVMAVELNPYPQFGLNCFDCFNCIRLCPEDAIEPAISLKQIEEHIKERVETINERPFTQTFL